MHSEDGTPQTPTPENPLLETDCVGCHSSDTNQTIVHMNSDRIPIVFNTSGYPLQPLAGGNFYNVSLGGAENDEYGHNVWGISNVDNNLLEAPGDMVNCANSCHESLATDPALTYGNGYYGINGCTGCHQSTKHHGEDTPDGNLETEESGWYRFLSGHYANTTVYGVEDPDWEQNPAAGHNKYQGVDYFYWGLTSNFGLEETHSITAFCRGCHKEFHFLSVRGPTQVQSPWLRHPTDYALPTTGEYANYDPVANYDPQVPVAWVNPETPAAGGAVVMCLSCHTAHGSEYPDMLRWDYNEMLVGTTGIGQGKGCFVCHAQKDG